MRAELKFDLPEENHEFKWARLGQGLHYVIDEFLDVLRDIDKYGSTQAFFNRKFTDKEQELVCELRDLLLRLLSDIGAVED